MTAKARVAWIVEIEDHACVAFADTRAKAKWIAVASWRDAGYGTNGRWPHVQAWRAKCYDEFSGKDDGPKAWCEDYVLESIRNNNRKGRMTED